MRPSIASPLSVKLQALAFILTLTACSTGSDNENSSDSSHSCDSNTYTTGTTATDCSKTIAPSLPTISVSPTSVKEGNSGHTLLTFTISLSAKTNDDVTVDYSISDGTATLSGCDYSSIDTKGKLTIARETTSTMLSISVYGDTVAEPDEDVVFTLFNPSANAALGTARTTGTILDDDMDTD